MKKRIIEVVCILLAGVSWGNEIFMPSIFSDHMVIQREQSVPVWGKAKPGAMVTVEFSGQKKTTKVAADSTWAISLDPMAACAEPQSFKITAGTETQTIVDVLIGEVWLCSGQSNMEMGLKGTAGGTAEVANATHPQIRLYQTPKRSEVAAIDRIDAQWASCTPESVANFSATAYYFGKRLQAELGVPVGLWQAAWGGTPILPWIPLCGYEGMEMLSRFQKIAMNMPAKTGTDQKYRSTPTALYNGMLSGNVPFAIRGVIWYQGEANRKDGMLYRDFTEAKLKGWRELWGYEFPYYFVQIPPFDWGSLERSRHESPELYPTLWEAQCAIEKTIPNTGMVVISDAADVTNLHPGNKKSPGTRLANMALANTFGREIPCHGPRFGSIKKEGKSLRVSFDYAEGLSTRDGEAPNWFEVAGSDGEFYEASARIDGETVVVEAAEVAAPVSVRLAWHMAAEANLMNKAGLPASSFRTNLDE